MAAPRVSILTATDRRPLVLRHAIASVLAQDMPEWELIAVSDGCTDDTEAVVRGFADPRIRWMNLPAHSAGNRRRTTKACGWPAPSCWRS